MHQSIIENSSTPGAQTSLVKEAHYPHIAQSLNLESQHGDPDQPKIIINCPLYNCRAILNISSKSAHNLLSNGQISVWAVSLEI